jgi:hypothetical protein
MWLLLARALASVDRGSAHTRFAAGLSRAHLDAASIEPRLQVTEIALRIISGQNTDAGLADFENLIRDTHNDQMEALLRVRMGRWLYRAGLPRQALQELLAARQSTPQNREIDLDLGYVMI